MRQLTFISVVILFLGCAGSPPPAGSGEAPGRLLQTESQADSLWLLRADSSEAHAALVSYEHLFSQDSGSISLGAKLARATYFYAQHMIKAPGQRDSVFMEGYQVSQTILNQNPAYHELLFSSGDENIAVRVLEKEYVDLLYWGMANYGQWLATKGKLIRLGQRQIIWSTLEHINDLVPEYYFGAYYRYKGALMSRDPEFQADTTEIRHTFEKARQIAPDYLGNNTLMAAYYCPLTNNKDLFYKLLTEVLTAPSNPELPYHPENLCEKRMAERLMIQAEQEKWFK